MNGRGEQRGHCSPRGRALTTALNWNPTNREVNAITYKWAIECLAGSVEHRGRPGQGFCQSLGHGKFGFQKRGQKCHLTCDRRMTDWRRSHLLAREGEETLSATLLKNCPCNFPSPPLRPVLLLFSPFTDGETEAESCCLAQGHTAALWKGFKPRTLAPEPMPLSAVPPPRVLVFLVPVSLIRGAEGDYRCCATKSPQLSRCWRLPVTNFARRHLHRRAGRVRSARLHTGRGCWEIRSRQGCQWLVCKVPGSLVPLVGARRRVFCRAPRGSPVGRGSGHPSGNLLEGACLTVLLPLLDSPPHSPTGVP